MGFEFEAGRALGLVLGHPKALVRAGFGFERGLGFGFEMGFGFGFEMGFGFEA